MDVWTLSAMEIDPASGISSPAIERNNVVLPQPEGPEEREDPVLELETHVVERLHVFVELGDAFDS